MRQNPAQSPLLYSSMKLSIILTSKAKSQLLLSPLVSSLTNLGLVREETNVTLSSILLSGQCSQFTSPMAVVRAAVLVQMALLPWPQLIGPERVT